jgi:tight adherence protein C
MHKFMPPEDENIYQEALLRRLLKPLIKVIGKNVTRFTPTAYKDSLQAVLLNLNNKYSLQDILMIKFLLLFFLFSGLVFYTIFFEFPNIAYSSMFIIILFIIPDHLLKLGLKKKRKVILHELPLFIELLSVILEGGLSFDNAVNKICNRKKGELYSELQLFLTDIKMGSTREEALKKLAARIHLKDFYSLSRSLIQGDKMGISILQTIKIQSEQIRTNQKQAIREEAMKIPIKLLFPLVMFIFPPIFIVILGPGMINIMKTLL